MSDTHLQVNENDGFIEICVQADHPSQTVFEVMLTTIDDDTATGESYNNGASYIRVVIFLQLVKIMLLLISLYHFILDMEQFSVCIFQY